MRAGEPQEDVWAQCDNPQCKKWRKLPPGAVVDENAPWYCNLNPDKAHNSCSIPEEDWNVAPASPSLSLEPSVESLPSSESFDDIESPVNTRVKRAAQSRARGQAQARGRGRGRGRQRGSDASQRRTSWNDRLEDLVEGKSSPPGASRAAPVLSAQEQLQLFQLMLGRAGSDWKVGELAQARTFWQALATAAPNAAKVATDAVNLSSAVAYFHAEGNTHGSANGNKEGSGNAAGTKEMQATVNAALAFAAAAALQSFNASPSPFS